MPPHTHRSFPIPHPAWLAIWLVLLVGGCARQVYRLAADADAYYLLQDKANDPRWACFDYSIDIDPHSRMFDPNSPDHPPMPPDDPAAHRLMHDIDHKRGYPCWHANGDTPFVQNPIWLASLPRDQDGSVEIDADSCVRLALEHSTNYQRQLEELYLSALDVSFERFRFDTQFFAGHSTFFTADGRARRGGGGLSRSALTTATFPAGTNIQARRLFSTGGELVVGLANSLMWQFAGPDDHTATTLLDFSLVQPLLRFGGRDRVLERLTISERALLGNVRQMERFRRGFYVEVVTGRFGPQGPSRRGGFFGGAGLEGFSGIGGGGFGRVGGFVGGNFGGGGGFASGAGAGQAGGFLGLLQTQQSIRNQRATIAALRSSVSQLESFFRAGRIDYFQVELARQALINVESQLLNAELAFQNSLDQFKITLGLPPQLTVTLDDELARPFELVDTALVDVQNRITRLQERAGQVIVDILELVRRPPDEGVAHASPVTAPVATAKFQSTIPHSGKRDNSPVKRGATDPPETRQSRQSDTSPVLAAVGVTTEWSNPRPGLVPQVQLVAADENLIGWTWSPELSVQLKALRELFEEGRAIQELVLQQYQPQIGEDITRLRDALQDRQDNIDRLETRVYRRLKSSFDVQPDGNQDNQTANATDDKLDLEDLLPIDEEQLRQLPPQLTATLSDIEQVFDRLATTAEEIEILLDEMIEQGDNWDRKRFGQQLRDRVLLPIPNLLNELSANTLSLTLVQARARTESVTLTPVDLRWQDALLTARQNRLDWMNARTSLVDTWRLIQFNADELESRLDLVFQGDIGNTGDNPLRLRSSTGRLRVGMQFESPLTRIAERNQYRQALIEYQQARRAFYQFEDQISASLRATLRSLDVNQLNFEFRRVAVEVAIAQVELTRLRLQEPPQPGAEAVFGNTTARDLVSALSDLLTAQNDFLSVWASQEVLRRALDLDLGTMQLDPRGLWVDPGPIRDSADGKDGPVTGEQLPKEVTGEAAEGGDQPRIESLPPPLFLETSGKAPSTMNAGTASSVAAESESHTGHLIRLPGVTAAAVRSD